MFSAPLLNFEPSILSYLIVNISLFIIGVFGIFFNRKNVIAVLMSIELMLLSVNLNFVTFSSNMAMGDLVGQIFAMFVLTVAAAEAAIGLAILVIFYRRTRSIDIDKINIMKG